MMSKQKFPPLTRASTRCASAPVGHPRLSTSKWASLCDRVEASEVVESADGLTIHLPEHLSAGRNELIRVVFAAEIFRLCLDLRRPSTRQPEPESAPARAEWRCQRRHCHQYLARPCRLDHAVRKNPRPAPFYRRGHAQWGRRQRPAGNRVCPLRVAPDRGNPAAYPRARRAAKSPRWR